MGNGAEWCIRSVIYLGMIAAMASACSAAATPQNRIAGTISGSQRTPLQGTIHPLARAEYDKGTADETLRMERVTLLFKPTQAQQESLNTLLRQQTDPTSPNYHRWLTPQQYAERFGLSQTDLNKVTAWLKSQGFTVTDVAPSRTWVAFSGSAGQVSSAFRTSIHQYRVNGRTQYANATEPSIPSALSGVVQGMRSLNNFRLKPHATVRKLKPAFTSSISGNHYLAPDDLAAVYNLSGLYSSGLDGTGQKIVIVGQTNIKASDISAFRSVSGLSTNAPQLVLVPGATDPGIVDGDITEANLDLEWTGAVARNATLVYVYSNADTAGGVIDALQYAIVNNLAPVISMSYGLCEAGWDTSDVKTLNALLQQANAQGITVLIASGDSGAADCDYSSDTTTYTAATHGLAVDFPASSPYVTAVGGTRLTEGSGSYWNSTNSASGGSALSYIPEAAWNDTTLSLSYGGGIAGGGGGKSQLITKPTWQTGTGVPDDGARDVPDVAFHASSYHDGYLACSEGSCVDGFRQSDGYLTVVGGTSVGAPVFAGIVALINQKTNSTQGNLNPVLYSLAASAPAAFHDITSGDNIVPCKTGTTDCPAGTTAIGYSAGTGYDLVTGLGSVDAAALLSNFTASSSDSSSGSDSSTADFQLAASTSSLTLSRGSSATATVTLTALNGFSGTPTWTCAVSSALTGTTCGVSVAASNPYSATITVTAPAQTTAALRTPSALAAARRLPQISFIFGGVFLTAWRRKRGLRRKKALGLLALALLAVALAAGCGGGKSSVTSSTTSSSTSSSTLTGTVTVQATSGSLSHSVEVAVVVN